MFALTTCKRMFLTFSLVAQCMSPTAPRPPWKMDESLPKLYPRRPHTMSLIVAFAGLALALGLVGIYGVLSFLVSKRTREIGIRIALGAQRGDVLWLILKEGAKFSLAGISLGLAGAFVVTRGLASELYGIGPMDPVTYVG